MRRENITRSGNLSLHCTVLINYFHILGQNLISNFQKRRYNLTFFVKDKGNYGKNIYRTFEIIFNTFEARKNFRAQKISRKVE